jgi:hypothetical protein
LKALRQDAGLVEAEVSQVELVRRAPQVFPVNQEKPEVAAIGENRHSGQQSARIILELGKVLGQGAPRVLELQQGDGSAGKRAQDHVGPALGDPLL